MAQIVPNVIYTYEWCTMENSRKCPTSNLLHMYSIYLGIYLAYLAENTSLILFQDFINVHYKKMEQSKK